MTTGIRFALLITTTVLGATIDNRYRILCRLGEGGMGAVFEAEHTGTGRRVAIKVIHTERARRPDMVARFQREARAAGAIDTPHIVQVLDTGTDASSDVIYTAMELLRGEDLRQVLQRVHRLSPSVAVRLAGQACLGLAGAHGAGVIHRDIKPANIFLCRRDDDEIAVKIVDFGIAKIKPDMLPQEDMALTTTGGMIGSPLYMSPEQALGAKTIDHRSDLWSLGVVLYEVLSGRLPHVSETLGTLIVAISTKDVPPLQDLAPWVPPEVARLVHRLLERDPAARFQSALELLDAIREVAPEGLSVRASEIAAVSDEERAQIAPRVTLGLDTEARSKLALTGTLQIDPADRTTDPHARSAGTAVHGASADNGLAVSHAPDARRPAPERRRVVPIAALAAVVVVGGLGVALLRAPAADGTPGPATAAPAPTAAPSAPTPTPEEREVRVAIAPPEATVAVDGHATPVMEGAVTVRGTLGSIHRVHIGAGEREGSFTVVISEEGPLPPAVSLPSASASSNATSAAVPSVASTAAVPRPPVPPQPPTPPKPPATKTGPLGPGALPPAATFE